MSALTDIDEPADIESAALELMVEVGQIWAPDSAELREVLQDLAGLMQVENVLAALDWNDARHVIGALGYDLVSGAEDAVLARSLQVQTGAGAAPLHDPKAVGAALLRVYELLTQPIAG